MQKYYKVVALILVGALGVSGVTALVGEVKVRSNNTYIVDFQEGEINEADHLTESLEESDIFAGNSYKQQLTTEQKIIYDSFTRVTPQTPQIEVPVTIAVKSNVELDKKGGFKSQEDMDTFSRDYRATLNDKAILQTAIDAFIKDHPEVYWLKFGSEGCESIITVEKDEEGRQKIYKEGEIYKVDVLFRCTTPIDEAYLKIEDPVGILHNKIEKIISENVKEGSTTYEKVKVLHDYLCKNIKYSEQSVYAHEAYGALIEGKCVCEGYAKAFKLLCEAENIPCLLAVGETITVKGVEAHMWNYVRMDDDKWYAVDVTWDDRNTTMHKYFLVGAKTVINNKTFFETHIAKGQFSTQGKIFSYPIIAEEKYKV